MIHLPINENLKVLADINSGKGFSDITIYEDGQPIFTVRKTLNETYFYNIDGVNKFSSEQIRIASEIMQHFNMYANFLNHKIINHATTNNRNTN